jgi:putative oxidoreductase
MSGLSRPFYPSNIRLAPFALRCPWAAETMRIKEARMKWLATGGKWLLAILLAVLMVGPGSQKFTGSTWERMFRTWGYPDGFYLVIGAIEVVAGIGLLIPRVASFSALTLAAVMAGAAATQLLRGGRNGVGEIVFMLLLLGVAAMRWRDRLRMATPASRAAPAS